MLQRAVCETIIDLSNELPSHVSKRKRSFSTENKTERRGIARNFLRLHSISVAKYWLVNRFFRDGALQNLSQKYREKTMTAGAKNQLAHLHTQNQEWKPQVEALSEMGLYKKRLNHLRERFRRLAKFVS